MDEQMETIKVKSDKLAFSRPVGRNIGGAAASLEREVAIAVERENKTLNLVILSHQEPANLGVRNLSDRSFIDSCDCCEVDKGDILDVFRDGAMRGFIAGHPYSGIIKIKFANRPSKLKFRRTKRDSTSLTYVRHDMTARQREQEKALRAELVRQRQENSNADLVIRNEEIIARPVDHNTLSTA